jgi:hypothetical protein
VNGAQGMMSSSQFSSSQMTGLNGPLGSYGNGSPIGAGDGGFPAANAIGNE